MAQYTKSQLLESSLTWTQRRSDRVDLCEINNLGSSLIDFCISTGKRFWLSLRRTPLFKSTFKAGSSHGKGFYSKINQRWPQVFCKGQPCPTSSDLNLRKNDLHRYFNWKVIHSKLPRAQKKQVAWEGVYNSNKSPLIMLTHNCHSTILNQNWGAWEWG